MSGEEESDEEDEMAPPEDSGPSEAELAMQRRREQLGNIAGVDEQTMELLELARLEREREEEEIQVLRARREQRKKERVEEEQRLAEKRSEEEARRKEEEEERKRKKEEEEQKRRSARDDKMAEMAKWKNPPKANFVISKADPPVGQRETEEGEDVEEKKSKEQLEAEKRAILAQRIQPLDISGFDASKLSEKAKELHGLIYRLETEKYDLEKRFKEQQYDMMELADRARAVNQVGRGGLKRLQDESDPIQAKFAGAPSKIQMYSAFERQQDKRDYGTRHVVFHGPTWIMPAERIKAMRKINWDENTGLPTYEEFEGQEGEAAAEGEGGEE